MTDTFEIDHSLTYEDLKKLLNPAISIQLSQAAQERIQKCRTYLDQKLTQGNETIYGINTGFGALCDTVISASELEMLQQNLLESHACGVGDEAPTEVVRLMLVLKIQSLAQGYSGVSLATVQRLVDFFNLEIYPIVYELGSLGASGDLAPLAHLSLPLIGKGDVYFKGEKLSAANTLTKAGLEPLKLQSKEGLALINGTQFMSAYGIYALLKAQHLIKVADLTAALSLDGFDCRLDPFEADLHRIRPHQGQQTTAKIIRILLSDSPLASQEKTQVQDPYAFRCIPQVHGATKDAVKYIADTFLTEINGVTDNPNIFPDEDRIISGGNFHGQPLALTLDYLSIALAELGNISERRTYQLISGQRNLPPFLTAKPGLNSGLMIAQYTAASIVSQNKQLCTPASVDSIVSSNGQEDHVSMGANAATKALKVVHNLEQVLAIEWLTASQALHFRRPLTSSPVLETHQAEYRREVSFIEVDRMLYQDIAKTVIFLNKLSID